MSDKLSFITALLVDARLCLDCIAHKAALRPVAAEAWLAIIARTVVLRRHGERCDVCLRRTDVFAILQPSTDPAPTDDR